MTIGQNRQREMEQLQHLLDVYGGDRDRWPARERLGVAALLAHDAEAQQLLHEARVFDAMIEGCQLPSARTNSGELNDLSRRIMARARAEKSQARPFHPMQVRATSLRSVRSRIWQAATLMAACLVTGIMVGQSGLVASPVEQTSEVSSLDETLTGSLPDDGFVFFVEEDRI